MCPVVLTVQGLQGGCRGVHCHVLAGELQSPNSCSCLLCWSLGIIALEWSLVWSHFANVVPSPSHPSQELGHYRDSGLSKFHWCGWWPLAGLVSSQRVTIEPLCCDLYFSGAATNNNMMAPLPKLINWQWAWWCLILQSYIHTIQWIVIYPLDYTVSALNNWYLKIECNINRKVTS